MSESSAALLQRVFGHSDLYAVLDVAKDASHEAIKRAYRKQALKHHPDRGGDKERFQALSLAHAVLSDAERRRVYDDSGSLDEDDAETDERNFAFWNDYFRSLFPALTTSKIEDFKRNYLGSQEERDDVEAAYLRREGELAEIMESVMFAEDGEEARVCALIDDAIAAGRVPSLPRYQASRVSLADSEKEREKKRKRRTSRVRHDDCERESDQDKEDEENEENEQEEDGKATEKTKRGKQGGAKKTKKTTKKSSSSSSAGDMDDLVAAIRNKSSSRGSHGAALWQSVFSKYGEAEGAAEEEPEIDDEEFERVGRRAAAKTRKTAPQSKKKSQKK